MIIKRISTKSIALIAALILQLTFAFAVPLPVTQTFNTSLGNWSAVSVSGASTWGYGSLSGNGYAAFLSSTQVNEDWLVSPQIDLTSPHNLKMAFDIIFRYGTDNANTLKLFISTDYNGNGNVGSATWTQLSFTMPTAASSWSSPMSSSGWIDLNAYRNQNVYIAFKATSDGSSNATRQWRVDNINVIEVIALPYNEDFASGTISDWSSVHIGAGTSEWQYMSDATYGQFAGINGNANVGANTENWLVSSPLDLTTTDNVELTFKSAYNGGTNAANELSLWITTNYTGNVSTTSWTQLTFTQPAGGGFARYNSGIVNLNAYRNSTARIAFKATSNGTSNAGRVFHVDDIAVVKKLFVEQVPYLRNFEDGTLEKWVPVNLSGPNQWIYNTDTYGKYAKITGNSTTAAGKDWLISPAINLDLAYNCEMTFRSASKYGTDKANRLSVWVSTNYTGNMNEAIWTELPYKVPTTNDFVWYSSGFVDLSAYKGDTVFIAFKAVSDGSSNATRQFLVDDISIKQKPSLAEMNYNQTFDGGSLADWASIRLSGAQQYNQWYYISNALGKYIKIQGNANEGIVAENWLVSPVLNLDYNQAATLDFKVATKFGNNTAGSLAVLVSENYTGNVSTATWQSLSYTYPATADFIFYSSGLINLDAYKGKRVTIAFKTLHDGTANAGRNYLIDSITVKEKPQLITPTYETEFTPSQDSLRYWTKVNVNGTSNSWAYHPYGFAQVTGNTTTASVNWLISPAVNLNISETALLNFQSAYDKGDSASNSLTVWASNNYKGNVSTATWTQLSYISPSSGNYSWKSSGDIDLSAYQGDTVYIAIKTTALGNANSDRTYAIDNLKISTASAATGGTDELETIVPSNWSGTAGSLLTISNDHYKKGSQSLRWDWTLGNITPQSLTVNNPTNIADGLSGLRGGMALWIYNENPIDTVLTFQYESATQVEYEFTFRLKFKGWRACWVRFDEDMWGPKSSNNIVRMKIKAPSGIASGTVFFDRIEFGTFGRNDAKGYSGTSDILNADNQMPFIYTNPDNHWLNQYYWSQLTPDIALPPSVSSSEQASFDSIENRFVAEFLGTTAPSSTDVQNAKTKFNSLGIVRNGNNIKGRPVFAPNDHILENTSASYDPNVASQHLVDEIAIILARDYKFTNSAESKQMYLDLIEHFLDQGFADGSGVGTLSHSGYAYRRTAQSLVIMKSELAAANLLNSVRSSSIWLSGAASFWKQPFSYDGVIDQMNTSILPRLAASLLQDNTPEKVRWLKAVQRWANDAVTYSNGTLGGLKVDNSLFHHDGFYPAYATGGLTGISQLIYIIRNTDFAMSSTKQANVKKAMYAVNIFSNKQWGMGISGRHPLDKSGVINQQTAFKKMALSGDPSTGSTIDSAIAGAYVRIWGADNSLNVSAETAPSGNWTYNYGALNIHRRGQWMATIKGYNKNVWSSEIYQTENRYGRYLSYGTVQVLDSSGDAGSGFDEIGWDWNKIPGATIIHLPVDKLESPINTSLLERSTETFAGAISFEGQHGAFGMILKENDRPNFDESFTARKSVFSFDNRIICIGTNIRNNTLAYSTQTNLFQGKLQTTVMPIWVNNLQSETTFPYNNTLNGTSSNWLLDSYKTGYYLPSGQTIKIQRSRQQSKHKDNELYNEGDFSSAWIDHGTAPRDASYEYAMLINTDAAGIKNFNDSMQNTSSALYKVHQQNDKAHIVEDKPTGIFGYVLFAANSNINYGGLKAVNYPCIVMLKNTTSQLKVSLGNPDLNFPAYTGNTATGQSQLVKIRATVSGEWQADGTPVKYSIISNTDSTVIEFDCKDGITVEAALVPKQLQSSRFGEKDSIAETFTSVQDESLKADFGLYPNPVSSELYVTIFEDTDGPMQIGIFDVSGKQVGTYKYTTVKGRNIVSIKVDYLIPGLYVVHARKGNIVKQAKFIKR